MARTVKPAFCAPTSSPRVTDVLSTLAVRLPLRCRGDVLDRTGLGDWVAQNFEVRIEDDLGVDAYGRRVLGEYRDDLKRIALCRTVPAPGERVLAGTAVTTMQAASHAEALQIVFVHEIGEAMAARLPGALAGSFRTARIRAMASREAASGYAVERDNDYIAECITARLLRAEEFADLDPRGYALATKALEHFGIPIPP